MPRKASRRETGSVRKLPSGKQQARARDPLTNKLVSIGTFRSVADADKAIALAVADQTRGAWVDPRSGRLKLADYSADWLRSRNLRPRTRETYEGLLRLHILPTLGAHELNRITTAVVRSWNTSLVQKNPLATTPAKSYRLLRAVLNTAVKQDELIVKNPCTLVGAGEERTPERPTASVSEVFALAAAMPESLSALVLLLAFTGLRLGESLQLRRRHLDLLHCTVSVQLQVHELKNGTLDIGRPKTDAGVRQVTFPSSLRPHLEAHLAHFSAAGPDGHLFPGAEGEPVRRGKYNREWTRARKVVGRRDLHTHDLRHTGNMLAAATPGVTPKDLMARMGQVSADAALRYLHASAERDAEIARSMDLRIVADAPEPAADVIRLGESGSR